MVERLFRNGLWIGLIVLTVNFVKANNSQYLLNQISVDERLPGANVYAVFQDKKGIVWFGIESVGLCKFDGKNYTIYSRSDDDSNTISNNFPLNIVEDNEGYLWIGTTDGLNRFDRNKNSFKRYLSNTDSFNCIPNNYIVDLIVDRFGNIWIATRQGLSKYIPSIGKFYNIMEGDYTNEKPAYISKVFEDKSGNIWIGSYSSGLFLIDSETNREHTEIFNQKGASPNNKLIITKYWKPCIKTEDCASISVLQICEFDKENLLLGKFDGLYLFNLKTEEFSRYRITSAPILNSSAYSALIKDSKGKIWAGSSTNGVLIIDNEKGEQTYLNAKKYQHKGLMGNTIRDIYEDMSGLIWIGTKFQGVHTYDSRQQVFNTHPYNEIMNKKVNKCFVLSIMEDYDKNIWIGTKNDGLFKFNRVTGKIIQYTHNKNQNSISGNRVESMAKDKNGNIWIGTDNGVNKLNLKTGKLDSYGDYFIKCLVSDSNGNLWIGTNTSGVFYIDVGEEKFARFKKSKHKDFFNEINIGTRAITITSDSLLWVSSFQNGLYKYNLLNDNLVHYIHSDDDLYGISGNMVREVFEDYKGEIWVCTKSNGLNKYDLNNGKFYKIKKRGELPPNTLYNIVQDNDGNLWMGSHEGLFKIEKTGKYILYNETYGLKSNVFETNARCVTHDGLIFVGGSEGLNVFDPKLVHKDDFKAPLIISSIKLYDRIIAEDVDEYIEVKAEYNDKYISIEFIMADYSDPLKINYKYMLENFDRDWIECGNRNYATYTSLPPGVYFFKVMAANSENIWTVKPLRIKIEIEKPYWRKPWFIFGNILLLIILTIIIYIARKRFLKRNDMKLSELVEIQTKNIIKINKELESHKANLEIIIKERTKELEKAKKKAEESDNLKSAFLANMSHEIRTPLNAIIGLSRILVSQLSGDEESTGLGQMIESNASALKQLIDDIIDISKIEANQVVIHKDAFPINKCLKNISNLYARQMELYKEYTDVNVVLDIPDEEMFIFTDQIRLEQILKNLVNNSLKFTKEGSITIGYKLIELESNEKKLKFFVKDTGIGIPKDELNSVFDRFKKSESKENIKLGGTGLGLSISYNLVILLEGKIWVESEVGKGSVFYFELPIEEEKQLSIEEILTPFSDKKQYNWEGKTILIVEDQKTNVIVLEEIIAQAKAKTIVVNNGESALEFMESEKGKGIDLILMDIRLPGIDGIKTTQKIKDLYPNIPVIAQTAFAMNHEEREILDSGFDDYISKPITKRKLQDKIARFFLVNK